MLKALLRPFKRRYRYKSSITGKFVTRLFALTHPTTTYRTPVED